MTAAQRATLRWLLLSVSVCSAVGAFYLFNIIRAGDGRYRDLIWRVAGLAVLSVLAAAIAGRSVWVPGNDRQAMLRATILCLGGSGLAAGSVFYGVLANCHLSRTVTSSRGNRARMALLSPCTFERDAKRYSAIALQSPRFASCGLAKIQEEVAQPSFSFPKKPIILGSTGRPTPQCGLPAIRTARASCTKNGGPATSTSNSSPWAPCDSGLMQLRTLAFSEDDNPKRRARPYNGLVCDFSYYSS